jgi:hypothetical protein
MKYYKCLDRNIHKIYMIVKLILLLNFVMNELMDFSINKFKELLSYFNMLKKIYFKNKLWKWYLL